MIDKQKLIDKVTKQYQKALFDIEAIPDEIIESCTASVSLSDSLMIHAHVYDIESLNGKLTELRKYLGNYTLETYFISVAGCVCASYNFEKGRVLFSLHGDDDAFVNHLSSGKCKIDSVTEKVIVCEL